MTTPVERACGVCIHNGRVLLVCLRDPRSKIERLFPPGGKLEPGESPVAAAIRETWEETGYRVRVSSPERASTAQYLFQWANETYATTTHFIRVDLVDATRTEFFDASFNLGPVWVDAAEVAAVLSFHAEIRDHTLALL